jgi:hypothetical protein
MKTSIRPILIVFALVSFVLLTRVKAVSPPPDGGYPGGNTAEGRDALLSLTEGTYNTAVGLFSLRTNREGSFNTAIGAGALLSNHADENTAIGAGALLSNTFGTRNTAIGEAALFFNTIGDTNTATGASALLNNDAGIGNTANGARALLSNNTGVDNTASGANALRNNTTGIGNTASGVNALLSNTTGLGNTANGFQALFNNTSGSNNTALGADAGANVTTADGVICIGALGADVSNSCFIGNIRDVATQNADAIPVLIDSHNQLGTASSSRRFKREIMPMDKASEAILELKPVTFHYKSDKKNTSQFGLIAEEVAQVNPDLVVHDAKGEIYTVRYDAVNAMLLNEFLKEHRKVEQLTKDFESKLAEQQKQIEALTTGLQKVNARLETIKPAPQVVNNP